MYWRWWVDADNSEDDEGVVVGGEGVKWVVVGGEGVLGQTNEYLRE